MRCAPKFRRATVHFPPVTAKLKRVYRFVIASLEHDWRRYDDHTNMYNYKTRKK